MPTWHVYHLEKLETEESTMPSCRFDSLPIIY